MSDNRFLPAPVDDWKTLLQRRGKSGEFIPNEYNCLCALMHAWEWRGNLQAGEHGFYNLNGVQTPRKDMYILFALWMQSEGINVREDLGRRVLCRMFPWRVD